MPGHATHQPAPPLDLDAMAAAALRRVVSQINRAAGQHLRAMRSGRPTQPARPLHTESATQAGPTGPTAPPHRTHRKDPP